MHLPAFKSRPLQPYGWLVCLLAVLFCLDFFRIVDFREKQAVDFRFRVRGERPADAAITLVHIDDASLKTFGQWPWPRGLYVRFLEILKDRGPAAVFFDILFTEASPDPTQDEALAAGLRALQKVILPFYYTSLEPLDAFFPLPALQQAVQTAGFVNVEPDPDGVTRKMRTVIQAEDEIYYPPALLLAALREKGSAAQAAVLRKNLPADMQQSFLINYPGTAAAYRSISFQDVLGLEQQKDFARLDDFFKDRVVIIGHTATGTTDLRPTPFSAADLGLSIQAAAAHTLLSQAYMHAVPRWFEMLLLAVVALLLFSLGLRLRLRYGLLALLLVEAAYFGLNLLLFMKAGWILPLRLPLTAFAAAAFLAFLFKYLRIQMHTELLERELHMAARIQETFLPQRGKENKSPFDLDWDCRFAKEVGGDLLDWVPLEDGRWGVVIGDVSGKGVPAALFMAKAISEFRREDKGRRQAGEVCTALNRACLADGGATGLFLTVFYGVLDPQRRSLDFAVAGHEPFIYYQHTAQKAVLAGKEGGPPLGLFDEDAYATQTLAFEPGDVLLLITDGVREMRNPEGAEYGMPRLCVLLEKWGAARLSAQEIIRNFCREWQAFQGSAPVHDDRTVICIRFPETGKEI